MVKVLPNPVLKLSNLPKTWIIDVDGVIFPHNRYQKIRHGFETPLPGVEDFFRRIPKEDFVLLVTSRTKNFREITVSSLKKAGIRYNLLLTGLPMGERIVINDIKPSGLRTAYALNVVRDVGLAGITFQFESPRDYRGLSRGV